MCRRVESKLDGSEGVWMEVALCLSLSSRIRLHTSEGMSVSRASSSTMYVVEETSR